MTKTFNFSEVVSPEQQAGFIEAWTLICKMTNDEYESTQSGLAQYGSPKSPWETLGETIARDIVDGFGDRREDKLKGAYIAFQIARLVQRVWSDIENTDVANELQSIPERATSLICLNTFAEDYSETAKSIVMAGVTARDYLAAVKTVQQLTGET